MRHPASTLHGRDVASRAGAGAGGGEGAPGSNGASARNSARRDGWHRQPLFWLGALILAASLAGCAWMILLASRYPDPALDTGGQQILKMPLAPQR